MSQGETPGSQAVMEAPRKKHKSKDREGKSKRKREHGHGDESWRHKSKKHRTDKHTRRSALKIAAADSPFHVQTASMYLPLAPISQRQPLEGMCAEHLSPLILMYYPPLGGVVLSYSGARLSERPHGDDGREVLVKCVDEFAVGFAWLTAEFVLFKPRRGRWLEGHIVLQNEGHLGLVCWNLFNASIERQRLPRDWRWVGAEDVEHSTDGENGSEGIGYYADGKGNRIKGAVKFRVKDVESSHDRERGFVSIEGTMLDDEDERKLLEQEHSRKNRRDLAGRRLGGARALGATSLGLLTELNPDGI